MFVGVAMRRVGFYQTSCKPAVGILEGFQAWQMWSRVQPRSS